MSSFPSGNLQAYKSSYILLENKQLIYVASDLSGQPYPQIVNIRNMGKFKRDLSKINPENKNYLHLSNEQVNKVITSNGGNPHLTKKSTDELSKDILAFAKQQMSEVQDIDRLRYVHLLKMGERLSNDENKAEYRQKAIDILTDGYKEPMLNKNQSDTFRTLYGAFYDGKMTQDEVKKGIMGIIIKPELELISKENPINEERYAYFVNLALNYGVKIPKNLQNPPVDHQKIVEYLSNRTDSKKALLLASHLNENIYREIVEPKFTPAYFLRQVGELIGLVKPRPKFTLQEHLALISEYPDLLKDPGKNNPYRIMLNKASPEDKLDFAPNLLKPEEKFLLLCKHGANNPDYSNALDASFFKGMDDQLLKQASLTESRSSNLNRPIYQALDQLIMTGTPKSIETIRTQLPGLFFRYAGYFSHSSPSTVNYWLNVAANPSGYEGLAGYGFESTLDRALTNLAKDLAEKGVDEFSPKEKRAIESIIKTINENKELYARYSKLPGVEYFIKSRATSESSEIPTSDANRRSVEITSELKNINNKAKNDTDGADKQIGSVVDLVAKKVNEIKPIPPPPESTKNINYTK